MQRSALIGVLIWILSVTLANAQEPDPGELLYENHCTECHDSVVHVRAQTKVKTRAELDEAISRWSDYKQLAWTDAEHNAVRDYLNLSFYGLFEDSPPPAPDGAKN